MTKFELMTVLYALKKLHEVGKPEAALDVINQIIAETETEKKKNQSQSQAQAM